ncbi:YkvA family protein [Clostridium polynesiense]|uniref:YkvA family protein n=1 Tax=Clostridium polynesiense TaxID=1325933 RepID=UPI0005912461|nr:DUF1232 domain-containing protein [Clostridium polynesiense]
MHISNVEAKLTEMDILSIINDFVKIDNLIIKTVKIEESIYVSGSYKSIIKLNFHVNAQVVYSKGKIIKLKIKSFKLWRLGILSFIRNIAAKIALKKLNKEGIRFEDNNIVLELDKLLEKVPFISLNIGDLNLQSGVVKVGLEDISISIDKIFPLKEMASSEIKESINENNIDSTVEDNIDKIEEEYNGEVEKVEDYYSDIRKSVAEKIPVKYEKYSDFAFIVPDILALLIRLFKDRRVKLKTKITLGICASYIALPLEIIPDKIPFIGKLDDLGVAVFGLTRVIEEVPKDIILSNWEGDNDVLKVVETALMYIKNFTTGGKIDKVYNFMEEMITV